MDIKTKGESGAEISDPSDTDLLDFDSIEATEDGSLISGFGAAIDLGAEMEVIDGLKISFAVNDLGYMSWKNTISAQTSGKGWSFEGFDEVALDGDKENSLKKQFEDLTDDMMDMFDFRRTEKDGTNGGMISATINAGVEYSMPFYRGFDRGCPQLNPHQWRLHMDGGASVRQPQAGQMVQLWRELRSVKVRLDNGCRNRIPYERIQHVRRLRSSQLQVG